MDMMKVTAIVVCLAVAIGCQSTKGYGNPDDDVYGTTGELGYTQMKRAIDDMIGRMLTDPGFTSMYKKAKKRAAKRKHSLPTVIIGKIEDNTRPGSNDYATTGQVRIHLKNSLRKTMKFEIIDLAERGKDDGGEGEVATGGAPDNVPHFGTYYSGDFKMSGELKREPLADGSFMHILNLHMFDPIKGTERWGDTVEIRKN